MGVSFNGHAGAIDWIGSRFKKGKPATLYFDEIRTPSYTDCLNLLCDTGAGQQPGGLVSRRWAAAAEPVRDRADHQSRRRLRSAICCWVAHARRPAPFRRVPATCRWTRASWPRALGHDPLDAWPYDEALVPTHREWHFERPADEPGSPELLAASCIAIHAGCRRALAAVYSAPASDQAKRKQAQDGVSGETQIDAVARRGL